MWGRLSSAWLAAVLTALLCAGSAEACSCAPQAPADSLREANAAVVGRLVEVVPRGRFRAEYRYEVGGVYRGRHLIEPGQVIEVRSARRAAACALPRRLGKRYGLFLMRNGGRWFGGICGVIAPRRLASAAQRRVPASGQSGSVDCPA